jgi:hypothetical protein
MPRRLNSQYLPQLPRLKQRTLSHCGPAVLSMLTGFIGYKVDQDEFVSAARVNRITLRKNGMDVDELALSIVRRLPKTTFWIKEKSTIRDLASITNVYSYPVGVEWQGVFGEWSNGDDGHYSIVIHVDRAKEKIVLIDPFWYYSGSDRIFSTNRFVSRWWDATMRVDKKTGLIMRDTDQQVMFVVTPKSVTFPRKIGMVPYEAGRLIRYGAYLNKEIKI